MDNRNEKTESCIESAIKLAVHEEVKELEKRLLDRLGKVETDESATVPEKRRIPTLKDQKRNSKLWLFEIYNRLKLALEAYPTYMQLPETIKIINDLYSVFGVSSPHHGFYADHVVLGGIHYIVEALSNRIGKYRSADEFIESFENSDLCPKNIKNMTDDFIFSNMIWFLLTNNNGSYTILYPVIQERFEKIRASRNKG